MARCPTAGKTHNQGHLENDTYKNKVTHINREVELNGLEAADKNQMKAVIRHATKPNSGKCEPTCHHFQKSGHFRSRNSQMKREEKQTDENTYIAGKINIRTTNSNSNNNNNKRTDMKPGTFYHPVRRVTRQTNLQRSCALKPIQRTDPQSEKEFGRKQQRPTTRRSKQWNWEYLSCNSNFKL